MLYNCSCWKRIKAVAMSRTRNAVVGVIRHVGSNPTASAKCHVFHGFFFAVEFEQSVKRTIQWIVFRTRRDSGTVLKCFIMGSPQNFIEVLWEKEKPCDKWSFLALLKTNKYMSFDAVLSARPKMYSIFSRFVLKICHWHISFTQSPHRFRQKRQHICAVIFYWIKFTYVIVLKICIKKASFSNLLFSYFVFLTFLLILVSPSSGR